MYALMRALVRFIANTYLVGLLRVEGIENVPREGPLLVCPNHTGTIDPPLVPAFLPRSDTWNMAKSEYFRNPVIRWLFVQYHAFPVVRHTADRAALRRSFDLLKGGHALVIYPEGTRGVGAFRSFLPPELLQRQKDQEKELVRKLREYFDRAKRYRNRRRRGVGGKADGCLRFG